MTVIRERGSDAVASRSSEEEQFSNRCPTPGSVDWEQALTLYYDDDLGAEWPAGPYEAEVRIDDHYGEETRQKNIEFEVGADSSA